MNHTNAKQVRILAIAPSARGFGYSVMEDAIILESGNKGVKGNKNLQSVAKIERLMKLFQPSVLVLPDVAAQGCHRAPRIQALHRLIIDLTKKRKCKVALLSGKHIRLALVGDAKGTKHAMAALLAQRFPGELAAKLPQKRRAWESEDGHMDMFDAVALAVVFRIL